VSAPIPAAVIGATGYVAGELLRLIAGHPHFALEAAVSESRAGSALSDTFPHLAPVLPDASFAARGDWLEAVPDGSRLAVFSAAPHGASAAMLADVIDRAAARRIETHVVDASADFRFPDRAGYEAVYGNHGAPGLLDVFSSGLPEHVAGTPTPHIGNPGCFATAMLLAIVPLLASGLTTGHFSASGITGSTGSGRQPQGTTHHPERHSNLYAYKPLDHRHAPEVVALAEAATGAALSLDFVPHSGPFARGIHMTVFAEARHAVSRDDIATVVAAAYADHPFVSVVEGMPKLKDVVASNYARLGIATRGNRIVVTVVIDNLVKGAAGGAMQWMNRLFKLPETTGLTAVAPAWT
jgi:N-acetyl-gamma-glutamyl-phosphate reductase